MDSINQNKLDCNFRRPVQTFDLCKMSHKKFPEHFVTTLSENKHKFTKTNNEPSVDQPIVDF